MHPPVSTSAANPGKEEERNTDHGDAGKGLEEVFQVESGRQHRLAAVIRVYIDRNVISHWETVCPFFGPLRCVVGFVTRIEDVAGKGIPLDLVSVMEFGLVDFGTVPGGTRGVDFRGKDNAGIFLPAI